MKIELNTDLFARDMESKLNSSEVTIKAAAAALDVEAIQGYKDAVSVSATAQIVLLCYDMIPGVLAGDLVKDRERWRVWRNRADDLIVRYDHEFEFVLEGQAEQPDAERPTHPHMTGSRLFTDDQIREIRALFADGQSVSELARAYEVSVSSIYKLIKRLTYRHIE